MRPTSIGTLGLVAGLAIGVVLGRGALGPGSGDAPAVALLEVELDRERAAAQELRERVAVLEAAAVETPAAASTAAGARTGTADSADPRAGSAARDEDASGGEADGSEGSAEPGATPGFDEARLLELGFHPADVERLKRAWESLELERLYIENERARSNQRDGRHWMRMRALEKDVQAELGDADYDAMLYASGRKNRARVGNVFPDSPAESAGLAAGDEILSYDDEAVFRGVSLKGRTTRCEMGRLVAVTVLRDGAERRLWVPCGPLGIQLEMVSAPPR